jgi:hypothetical protein
VSVGVLQSADLVNAAVQAEEYEQVETLREASGWSPENFAREQIRGLVRQVFFSSVLHPVRQVVFCAADSGTEIGSICRQVAETLALDAAGSVALVSHNRPSTAPDRVETNEDAEGRGREEIPPRQGAIRIRKNLWLVSLFRRVDDGHGPCTPSSRLGEIRREFEYSIVQGPAAGESSEAAALGQSADGIVLVLAAHVTRRAMALKVKQTLEAAQVRLLGTVLSERRFPIPEAIYQRL